MFFTYIQTFKITMNKVILQPQIRIAGASSMLDEFGDTEENVSFSCTMLLLFVSPLKLSPSSCAIALEKMEVEISRVP